MYKVVEVGTKWPSQHGSLCKYYKWSNRQEKVPLHGCFVKSRVARTARAKGLTSHLPRRDLAGLRQHQLNCILDTCDAFDFSCRQGEKDK